MQNFERNWANSICIRVNNFPKSVNFEISQESSQRKKLKLPKIEYYYYLCRQVYVGKLKWEKACGKLNLVK